MVCYVGILICNTELGDKGMGDEEMIIRMEKFRLRELNLTAYVDNSLCILCHCYTEVSERITAYC